jgi:hypothetical protein
MHAVTLHRLEEFRRRRNRLLLIRSLAGGVLILLLAALLCAFVDARWLLTPSVRWSMTIAIYGLAMAAWFGLWIRPWLRGRSLHWLAEHLEQIEPRLKDRLVPAVELSIPDNLAPRPPTLDSLAFRESLQRSVAHRIDGIDVAKLLPWKMIQGWLSVLWLVLLGLVVACCIPNFYLTNRLGRVLLPMLDIGRVSKFAIEVVEPQATEHVAPEDDIVLVQADVFGELPQRVTLQIDRESLQISERPDLEMNLEGPTGQPSRYQVHWAPPLGTTRYRIVADDAFTAWRTIKTVARPRVENFEIEYQFPEYVGLPNEIQHRSQGDLEALTGTLAKITFETNQPSVTGQLQFKPKDRSRSAENQLAVPLERSGDGRLTASLPIQMNGTYQVELTAAETNFTNAFSPSYIVTARDDQPPRVRWLVPSQMTLPVKPNDLLELVAMVEDEVPVASIQQEFRVSPSEWQSVPRELPAKAEDPVNMAFDLLPMKVQAGDLVQTKVVATDRRGQSSSTDILELIITSLTLDPNRQTELRQRSEVSAKLELLQRDLEQSVTELSTARENWAADSSSDLRRQELSKALETMARTATTKAREIRSLILSQVPRLSDAVHAYEYDLLHRNLARLESDEAHQLLELADQVAAGQDVSAQQEKIVHQMIEDAERLARRSRDFVSQDIISQVGQDLRVLLNYQQELSETMNSLPPEQYRRRQALVAHQMEEVAALLREHLPTLRNRAEKTSQKWIDWLEIQADKILDTTGRTDRARQAAITPSESRRLGDQVLRELQSHQNAINLDGQIAQEQLKARQELEAAAGTASGVLSRLPASPETAPNNNPDDALSDRSPQSDSTPLEQLGMRRELQQAKEDGDNQFVADLGEAARAAKKILAEGDFEATDPAAEIQSLASAMKVLESAHEFQLATTFLKQLHEVERWDAGSLKAQFEQPRVWEAFQQQLSDAIKHGRDAGFDPKALKELQETLKGESSKKITEKVNPRRWSSQHLASAAAEIEKLEQSMRASLVNLQPAIETACQKLATLTPTVSQLAQEAADKVESVRETTEELARTVDEDTLIEPERQLDRVERQLHEAKAPLRQLRDGLADLASRQDLLNAGSSRVARDADAAIGMTHEAQKQLQESFDQVAAVVQDPTQLGEELAKAATKQSEVHEALQTIAEHFDNLGHAEDSTAPPPNDSQVGESPLNAAEELAKNPEMNQAHNNADRLQKLATLDPKRVLAELERELQRNKPMQAELSEIAREAVDEALATLNYAANKENRLQVELENSDRKYLSEKENLLRELQYALQATKNVNEYQIPRVEAAAQQSRQGNVQQNALQLSKELAESASRVSSLNSSDSLTDLQAAAKRFQTDLDVFSRRMTREAVNLESAAKQPIVADPRNTKDIRRSIETQQSEYRDQDIHRAFNAERDHLQELRQSEALKKKAESQLQQAEKHATSIQNQFANRSNADGLIERATKAAEGLLDAKAELEMAKQQEEAALARKEKLRERREALQLRKAEPLNDPNLYAEFGMGLTLDAAHIARTGSEDLLKALADVTQLPAQADNSTLAEASSEQTDLQANVAKAANGMARAARHEERLNNPTPSQKLAEQAQQVDALVNDAMQQASALLAQALAQPSEQANRSSATGQAQAALNDAETGLRSQAASLEQAMTGKTPTKETSSPTGRTSTANAKNQVLTPQELARMLDELDFLLNAEKSPPNENPGSQQSAKSPDSKGQQSKSGATGEPSESQPPETAQTLAQAAQKLTSEMNQQRQAMESSQANPSTGSPESQSRSPTQPGQSAAGNVPPVEIRNPEDWGKLREQSSEDAREGDREELPAAFRALVEEYFRRLSDRGS